MKSCGGIGQGHRWCRRCQVWLLFGDVGGRLPVLDVGVRGCQRSGESGSWWKGGEGW